MFMHDKKKSINFSNQFLDKLALDGMPSYLEMLRIQAGFSRDDLAKALGFNAGSIRRYESSWGKPPLWYPILLRFLCGDLSYFGLAWHECRLYPHDAKLVTHYQPYLRFNPMDLNIQYSKIANVNARKVSELQTELNLARAEIESLKREKHLLNVRLMALIGELDLLKLENLGVKAGKIVKLFK